MTQDTKDKLEHIAACIEDAGLSPHDQLFGYFLTGNPLYITRNGNARDMVQYIDKKDLKAFIEGHNK